MRATGIVRRIDDLGRVVIPKEIRRTMKIKEGDPLEIFTGEGGEVVFKKYSTLAEFEGFATAAAKAVFGSIQRPIIVTDRDRVVAVAGTVSKEIVGSQITAVSYAALEKRKVVSVERRESFLVCENSQTVQAYAPIISCGDILGGVFLCGEDEEVSNEMLSALKIASNLIVFLVE